MGDFNCITVAGRPMWTKFHGRFGLQKETFAHVLRRMSTFNQRLTVPMFEFLRLKGGVRQPLPVAFRSWQKMGIVWSSSIYMFTKINTVYVDFAPLALGYFKK